MKTYIFDFEDIQSYPMFYDKYMEICEVPAHFGRNLDALFDILPATLDLPCSVEFINFKEAEKHHFKGLKAVFEDTQEALYAQGFRFIIV